MPPAVCSQTTDEPSVRSVCQQTGPLFRRTTAPACEREHTIVCISIAEIWLVSVQPNLSYDVSTQEIHLLYQLQLHGPCLYRRLNLAAYPAASQT